MALKRVFYTSAFAISMLGAMTVLADEAPIDADEEEAATERPRRRIKKKRTRASRSEARVSSRRPEVGDPPEEIEAYLAELRDDAKAAKRDLKEARRNGEETADLAIEADEKARLYDSERNRLTTNSPGMIAGGAVMLGVGVASIVASLVSLIGWGFSAIDGNADDEWGYAALVSFLNGVAGIAGGAPTLAIGTTRRPREITIDAHDAAFFQNNNFVTGFSPGASVVWRF